MGGFTSGVRLYFGLDAITLDPAYSGFRKRVLGLFIQDSEGDFGEFGRFCRREGGLRQGREGEGHHIGLGQAQGLLGGLVAGVGSGDGIVTGEEGRGGFAVGGSGEFRSEFKAVDLDFSAGDGFSGSGIQHLKPNGERFWG